MIHNGDCCPIPIDQFVWDKRTRLNPHADYYMCLAILELTTDDKICRAPGECPQVVSREAEMNIPTFVQVLVGFLIYLLNTTTEVSNGRSSGSMGCFLGILPPILEFWPSHCVQNPAPVRSLIENPRH